MRPLVLLAIALVTLVVVGTAGGAVAQGPTRIVLETKPITSRVTDQKPKGPSAGDRSFEKTKLLNAVPQFGRPVGAVVGHDQGTTVLESKTTFKMTGVVYLPGGTLTLSGRIKPDAKRGGFFVPVTRGAGAFAGARGTLWVVRVPNPTRVFNVYTLRYAGA